MEHLLCALHWASGCRAQVVSQTEAKVLELNTMKQTKKCYQVVCD